MVLSFENNAVPAAVTTILVAACDGSHRSTLTAYLEHRGFQVVVTDSAEMAMQIASSGAADMVVTGPKMPGLDGYALTRDLRTVAPELPVILMSAGGDRLSNALLDCTMAVSGQDARRAQAGSDDFSHARVAKLTRREREVLRLVAKGHRNKSIARQLSISPRTVENHRAQVMRKMNARSLADLVRLDLSLGEPQASGIAA